MMLARLAFITRPYREGLGLLVTRSRMPIRSRRMAVLVRGRPFPWLPCNVGAELSGRTAKERAVGTSRQKELGHELRCNGGRRWSSRPRIASRSALGNMHPQSRRSDPVFQRGAERNYLAIQGYLDPRAPGLYGGRIHG